MKLIITLTLFFTLFNAYSLDWEKCKSFYEEFGLLDSWAPSFSSTTQYISSWGSCSMMGVNSHDKKVFIAFNLKKMQEDSARGGGEYLEAYAHLSGCSEEGYHELGKSAQKNFHKIYGAKLEYNPKTSYEQIENLLTNNPRCSQKS